MRRALKYKLLYIDFYFGAGSEVSRATIKSTTEKIIILCSTINILPSFAESRQIEVLAWDIVRTRRNAHRCGANR